MSQGAASGIVPEAFSKQVSPRRIEHLVGSAFMGAIH